MQENVLQHSVRPCAAFSSYHPTPCKYMLVVSVLQQDGRAHHGRLALLQALKWTMSVLNNETLPFRVFKYGSCSLRRGQDARKLVLLLYRGILVSNACSME